MTSSIFVSFLEVSEYIANSDTLYIPHAAK